MCDSLPSLKKGTLNTETCHSSAFHVPDLNNKLDLGAAVCCVSEGITVYSITNQLLLQIKDQWEYLTVINLIGLLGFVSPSHPLGFDLRPKHFLWALNQMDRGHKSKSCRKSSIWRASLDGVCKKNKRTSVRFSCFFVSDGGSCFFPFTLGTESK